MFRTALSSSIALLICAQACWADTRIVVDTPPSPEAYASMLGIELEPAPRVMSRGIRMHEPETAGQFSAVQQQPSTAGAPQTTASDVTVAAPVNFALDSDRIPASFEPYLDNLAVVLRAPAAQQKVLIVSGHTDSQGAASYNLDLSERRALSVRDYLIAHGVAPRQLISLGKGESELISGQESNHALNRRVEFRVAG